MWPVPVLLRLGHSLPRFSPAAPPSPNQVPDLHTQESQPPPAPTTTPSSPPLHNLTKLSFIVISPPTGISCCRELSSPTLLSNPTAHDTLALHTQTLTVVGASTPTQSIPARHIRPLASLRALPPPPSYNTSLRSIHHLIHKILNYTATSPS